MGLTSSDSIQYPPIAIALATYNGEKYLEEQLDSILSQTLSPREIIVCDDLSTDGTIAILKQYEARGHIKLYRNESRLGYIGNFKKAVALASDDCYVALTDQDDVWLPRKLEAAMGKILSLKNATLPAMVYSDLVLVDQNKALINNSFRNELGQDSYQHSLETLLFGGFVNGCTMLMNPVMKKLFSTIPDNKIATHDTWIALIAYTFGQVAIVPEPLILYRRHNNNASELNEFKRQGRFARILSEVKAAFKANNLFENEISSVQKFYDTFHTDLNSEQKNLVTKFLSLKGKSYLVKKMALRRFFAGKWN